MLETTHGLPYNVTTEIELALWQTAVAINAGPVAAHAYCLRLKMMKYKMFSKVLTFLIAVFLSKPAGAMVASDLQDLKIIGYHFTTHVSSDKSLYFSKDPLNSRIVILKFSTKTSSNDGILFTTVCAIPMTTAKSSDLRL